MNIAQYGVGLRLTPKTNITKAIIGNELERQKLACEVEKILGDDRYSNRHIVELALIKTALLRGVSETDIEWLLPVAKHDGTMFAIYIIDVIGDKR